MIEIDFFDFETLQEDHDVECKASEGREASGKLPKNIWETYSAMANTEGGYIYLGIREQKLGSFDFVGVLNSEKVLKEFWNGINNSEKVSVNILQNRDVAVKRYGNTHLIIIRVPQASRKERPVYINGNPFKGTFRRNNDGDYRCSEKIVKQMLGEQENDTCDGALLEHFGLNDIEQTTLQVFRQHFSNRKPTHPFNDCDTQEFLRQIGAWGIDRQNNRESLTLAGLLMFGKLRSILDAVPNYIVDYQEHSKNQRKNRWVDRVTTDFTWSGNLYDFYRKSIEKLYNNLKVPFALSGDLRIEDTPVHEALREALVNTLIHAGYLGSSSLLIIKQPDLFVFRNPGLLRIPRREALIGGTSDCRNRNLQKMFQLTGVGEQAGSGFPKIYKNWKEQCWRNPELEERFEANQTVLTLRMSNLLPEEAIKDLKRSLEKRFEQLTQIEKVAVVTAKTEGCVTHRRLAELYREDPLKLSKTLHGLVSKNILKSEGFGKATFYYLSGKHPIQNEIYQTSISPNKSSEHLAENSKYLAENSEHLSELEKIAKKVNRSKKSPKKLVKETILRLCDLKNLSLPQLATLLQREEDSIRNHYITPLCEEGFLQRLYPNIIHHPKQRYLTSKRGKEVIKSL